jgi:hypothetical protein
MLREKQFYFLILITLIVFLPNHLKKLQPIFREIFPGEEDDAELGKPVEFLMFCLFMD